MIGRSGLFLAGPAVGADLVLVDADGFEQTLNGLIAERAEAELLADGFQQALAALGVAVSIFFQMLLPLIALQILHSAAHQQFHVQSTEDNTVAGYAKAAASRYAEPIFITLGSLLKIAIIFFPKKNDATKNTSDATSDEIVAME